MVADAGTLLQKNRRDEHLSVDAGVGIIRITQIGVLLTGYP